MRTTTERGAPLYLGSNQFANKWFANGAVPSHLPKSKHTFFALIRPTEAIRSVTASPITTEQLVFSTKAMELPKPEYDLDVIDQYNRTRLVNKKVSYAPISVRFHNDTEGHTINVFEGYNRYYFGDSRHDTQKYWYNDVISGQLNPSSVDFGLQTKTLQYFSRIDLFWLHGNQRVTAYSLFNPLIRSIDWGNVDYEDNTASEISVTFEYEGYSVVAINEPIKTNGSEIDVLATINSFFGKTANYFDPVIADASQTSGARSFGLGDLFVSASNALGASNGEIDAGQLALDYIVNPFLSSATSSLQSFGNFQFGGGPASGRQNNFGVPFSQPFGDIPNVATNVGSGIVNNFVSRFF